VLISILLIACVVSASFVALRLFASSTTEHQTIYVEPSYLQVVPCTNFTVNVRIRNVVDLYSWQFNMTFDPNLMQCVSVTEGPFLSSNGTKPTIFPPPIIDNTHGEIMTACALMAPPGTSGGCVLAYITFHCTAPGSSSLVLHHTILINSEGITIGHNVENGTVQQRPFYRYKAKFEYGWQSELVGAHFPSLNVPVETFTTTHINVFNPNHYWVNVTKYFVKVWPENLSETLGFDGHTSKQYMFMVPPNKGFEIDWEDICSWPDDTLQPVKHLLCESFFKGFVVIECPYELNVVAVYDKVGVDVVNKITFHIRWPTCEPGTYHPPPPGLNLKYNTLYTITRPRIPPELDPGDLESEVRNALNLTVPNVDIKDIAVVARYFDFLNCTTKETIQFTLLPPISEWYAFLDYMWPPAQRPEGWTWPDWFKPCTIKEQIVKIRSFPHLNSSVWETFWSMGDVNHDGYINYKDLDLILAAYGSHPGDPNWNPDCDLNCDYVVDSTDIYIWTLNQGKDIWTYSGMPPLESWGPLEKIRDPEKMIRQCINSTLIESGVPPAIAAAIVKELGIEIKELDVAEGVGTSMDVEYIEPEIITVP